MSEYITMSDWYELPSDCRGDGYDIAELPHTDDRATLEVTGDRVVWRERVYTGSFRGSAGRPALRNFVGYHAYAIDLDARLRAALAGGLKVVMQYVSKAKGGWSNARTRGYYRVAVVDPTRHHRRRSELGYLGTIWTSDDVTHDYAGGRWGYGAAARTAQNLVAAIAAATKANGEPTRLAA